MSLTFWFIYIFFVTLWYQRTFSPLSCKSVLECHPPISGRVALKWRWRLLTTHWAGWSVDVSCEGSEEREEPSMASLHAAPARRGRPAPPLHTKARTSVSFSAHTHETLVSRPRDPSSPVQATGAALLLLLLLSWSSCGVLSHWIPESSLLIGCWLSPSSLSSSDQS